MYLESGKEADIILERNKTNILGYLTWHSEAGSGLRHTEKTLDTEL